MFPEQCCGLYTLSYLMVFVTCFFTTPGINCNNQWLLPVIKDLPLGKVTGRRFIISGWKSQANACDLITVSQWQKLCLIAATLGTLSPILSALLWKSPNTWLSTLERAGDPYSFVGLPWIVTSCMKSDPALLSLVSDQILTLQFISNSSSQNACPNMARQVPLWTFGCMS